jgi:hypothetical protein
MTQLIFLNIAALHHYPYSRFLHVLGKYELFKLLQTEGLPKKVLLKSE